MGILGKFTLFSSVDCDTDDFDDYSDQNDDPIEFQDVGNLGINKRSNFLAWEVLRVNKR